MNNKTTSLRLIIAILFAISQQRSFGQAIPSDYGDTPLTLPTEAILGTGSADFAPQQDLPLLNIALATGIYSNRISIINPTGFYDFKEKQPTPQKLDDDILMCHALGLRPMFLFNYYDKGREKITFFDWKAIGQQFADRFKPNSAWLISQGIKNWGVTMYSALNEPENQNVKLIPIPDYVTALKDFADGIHASDPRLHVFPGGYFTPCAYSDYTCKGYALALAPYFNDGTFDGIDLHDYNGNYAPITKPQFTGQGMFDLVKRRCGITRDIDYYCTEFNGTAVGGEKSALSSEPENAKVLLTAMWTHLTVTGNGGISLANLKSMSAMPYAPTGLLSHAGWGLAAQLDPWMPTARGQALVWTSALVKGMHFTDIEKGFYQLAGNNRKLWVLQNRSGFTSNAKPVQSIKLCNVPSNATDIEVWYADGLINTVPTNGMDSVTVDNLRPEETVMFLARPKFLGLVSRKIHGENTVMDLPLENTTEPRSNAKGLTLVFNFAGSIASANLTIVSGSASLSGPLIYKDNSVVANFNPPADKQLLQVKLSNIKNAAGESIPDINESFGLLYGDVDGNGVVDAMDASLSTYNASPTALGMQRVRDDIDLSGKVDAADSAQIRAQIGNNIIATK